MKKIVRVPDLHYPMTQSNGLSGAASSIDVRKPNFGPGLGLSRARAIGVDGRDAVSGSRTRQNKLVMVNGLASVPTVNVTPTDQVAANTTARSPTTSTDIMS